MKVTAVIGKKLVGDEEFVVTEHTYVSEETFRRAINGWLRQVKNNNGRLTLIVREVRYH